MTRDDILRMAQEAGIEETNLNLQTFEIQIPIEFFIRFAKRVAVAKEQEMLAEGWVLDFPPPKEEADE